MAIKFMLLSLLSAVGYGSALAAGETDCGPVLASEYRLLASTRSVDLCQSHQGKLVLVVNTASQCGFTGQFEGLEALYQNYKDQGLVILGFPSDDFNQEHADEEKTAEVCQLNYGVSFPMFATTSVRGETANPLFKELAKATREPSWNFNKYLIHSDGRTVEHFGSRVSPLGDTLEARISELLAQSDFGPN